MNKKDERGYLGSIPRQSIFREKRSTPVPTAEKMIAGKIHITMRYRPLSSLFRVKERKKCRAKSKNIDREFLFQNLLCKLRRKARVEWLLSFVFFCVCLKFQFLALYVCTCVCLWVCIRIYLKECHLFMMCT